MSKATVKKLHWRSKVQNELGHQDSRQQHFHDFLCDKSLSPCRLQVQESFVPLGSTGSSGELGLAIGGGADYGEFPFVTAAPGGGATVGDIILEIGGTPVLGMTLGDVRGVLNSCPHPIRIKTVSPGEKRRFDSVNTWDISVSDITSCVCMSGSSLCKDLRLYLSKCFTPGSMDSQLQQLIRENLYLRAVPCKTHLSTFTQTCP